MSEKETNEGIFISTLESIANKDCPIIKEYELIKRINLDKIDLSLNYDYPWESTCSGDLNTMPVCRQCYLYWSKKIR
jgi:hypothetical protein